MVRSAGFGGSVWVMGEWIVGRWIVGIISFQKMYGLYGLKHHMVEISGDVTDAGRTGQVNDRATQLLICEKLSLAISTNMYQHNTSAQKLSPCVSTIGNIF